MCTSSNQEPEHEYIENAALYEDEDPKAAEQRRVARQDHRPGTQTVIPDSTIFYGDQINVYEITGNRIHTDAAWF